MKLKIGSPVSGDNFFPRPDVIRRLRNALNRDHVSFLAPRRTGKTSVLIHLEATAPEDHPHLRINLETCARPDQMIAALASPFVEKPARWKASLGKAWDKIDSIKIGPAGVGLKDKSESGWEEAAAMLLEALQSYGGPFTFLLDEFPILVDAAAKEDRDGCEAMLRWFREWRQRTADTSVRFLVTGSIGLDNVVRRHGFADTVNDFDCVTLPPLEEEEATTFIAQLAEGNGLTIDERQAKHMINLLGNAWPYFIQIFVAGIEESDPETIDRAFLEQAYRDHLVAGPRNKYVPHMWDRIDKVFAPEQRAIARAVLRALAHAEDGLTGDQMKEAARSAISQSSTLDDADWSFILDVLKHDGYLTQDTAGAQRTRFFTNLLRDYWRRRYA